MGNNTSDDRPVNPVYDYVDNDNDNDDKKIDQPITDNSTSCDIVRQCENKWLSSIRFVPLLVSSNVYGMNINKNKQYLYHNQLQDIYFRHYGVQINVSDDCNSNRTNSYLLYPDYHTIINEYRQDPKNINTLKIEWDVIFKYAFSFNFDYNINEMHCDNFGFMSLDYTDATSRSCLVLSFSNQNIYNDLFTIKFASISVLPQEILKIIIYEYIQNTNNDVQKLLISKPIVNINDSTQVLSYKLLQSVSNEKIVQSATSLFGKYLSFETKIKIYDPCNTIINPIHQFLGKFNVFQPIKIRSYCKINSLESYKLFWNNSKHSMCNMSQIIHKCNPIVSTTFIDGKYDDSDNEEFLLYNLDFYVIQRTKHYELNFYRRDNFNLFRGLRIGDGDDDDYFNYIAVINGRYSASLYKLIISSNSNTNGVNELMSLNTLKIYGGCCIANDRVMKFEHIDTVFTNCIVIWNPSLIPNLLACGTYNIPTARVI